MLPLIAVPAPAPESSTALGARAAAHAADNPALPKYYGAKATAAALGVSVATLYRWEGKHPAPLRRTVRRRRRVFSAADIDLIRGWMRQVETGDPPVTPVGVHSHDGRVGK